ncbi:GlsB/YeaQ/YmgE family stress response membrane protein [Amycolatopsis sp. NBC_00345]|uniref:GlsB/YeaQ/YmgE family stress response membrane protein n=1 Tax=Amycolatopsis sp. NBC_00345 TaxID=2975955 RepID=UPI002E256233
MSIIAWIILGLVAGVIAKSLLGRRAKHGVIVTILIGVAGALLGGWVAAQYLGIDATKGFFDLSTWVTAIVGSVVLLLIYHAFAGGIVKSRRGWRVRR